MKNKFEYKIFGNGFNTLVIELGIGCSWNDWLNVIDELKDDFTIFIYRRLGYGNSCKPQSERTTRNIAMELHSLLVELNINNFIMVGHSFGGLCTIQFAKMYKEMIKAVVLVDSTSFNWKKLYELNNPVMNEAISIDKMAEENFKNGKITIGNEFKYFEASANDIKSIDEFPNVPLTVIARDKDISANAFVKYDMPRDEANRYEDVWRELQIELSNLSTRGKLVIAEGSDHEVYLDKPEVLIRCLTELKDI
ncbi:alpha/beta hydrolase [Sedimentibacter sp. zth1]|uniref:alpha/beta fold hydrolase n=1 Tax=Sedimentibacter sp. zth1 TaxID=2816908 RepID=UPI001A90FA21|nr:alpha/beta hydrolase [Sedimentibacter sp. zth1]QSX07227.1 alpha/beta hydrolase [Sedimentibacter sp. zth1]